MRVLCPAEAVLIRIGGLAVPAVGDQAAVGLVLPHQRLAVFSCQTTPLTKASSLTLAVTVSTTPFTATWPPLMVQTLPLASVMPWVEADVTTVSSALLVMVPVPGFVPPETLKVAGPALSRVADWLVLAPR